MTIRTVLVLAITMLSLAGCVDLSEPKIMYKDAAHPQSDTAVFAVRNVGVTDTNVTVGGAVVTVDGSSTVRPCMTWCVPSWVRVLPGTQDFKVVFSKQTVRGEKVVHVPDMLPGHVYIAELHDAGMSFGVTVRDDGEHSDFTMTYPKGATARYGDFKATF